MEQQKKYITALYCRLSQDDGVQGDSSSIQTQKAMLERYAQEQGFRGCEFYVDDGFSGTNFNRPAFQKLLKDIDNGIIHTVITKDLSRLGRDYIQTGYYSEVYFPEKNVRYIAINDNFDSSRDNNDIAPFKNILNDMYAKDLSRKIKASRRQRALQGMFTGGCAPYGYIKDPNNKNKLLIDPETATVVRHIFNLMLSGYGAIYIARQLMAERIPTPAVMKAKQGDTRFQRYIEDGYECRWSDGRVHKILIDPSYTGAIVSSKQQIVNHKTKKCVNNSKDKWIVVPNMHEAIISKEEFDKVQQLIKERHQPKRKYEMDNPFRGLVKCAVCGKNMILTTQMRRGKLEIYYRCNSFNSIRAKEKHWTTVNFEEVKGIVVKRLKEIFSSAKDDDKLKELIRQKIKVSNIIVDYDKELSKIETRKLTLANITKKVYEDFFAGVINEETYQDLIKKYQLEQGDLKERQAQLLVEQSRKDTYLEDMVQSYFDLKILKREMLYNLIDKIVISNIGGFKKHKQRTIDITYRFMKP